MKSKTIEVRITPEVAESFRALAASWGMTLSEGVRVVMHDALRSAEEYRASEARMTERELERCFDASVPERDMARMFGLDVNEAEMMDALTLGEVER